MRKIKAMFLGLIMVGTILLIAGCGKGNQDIENAISEFEYACNTLDIDAMLDCITPEVSDNIRLGLSVVGMFAETDTDEMFDVVAEFLLGEESGVGSEFFSSIKIEIEKINKKGDRAVVNTNVTFEVNGEEFTKPATFECSNVNDKWYVSSFMFQ